MRSVSGYDAVVVGGALYAFRWHLDARRFVRRFAGDLRGRPTYLFSSGPLDGSAAEHEIPPIKGVQALMDAVGAKGHMTFGGRLAPDAKGFPSSTMAKKHAGDWRDPEHVPSSSGGGWPASSPTSGPPWPRAPEPAALAGAGAGARAHVRPRGNLGGVPGV